MHHNLKIEMERVNNQYVTQIELSTFGRCGRARLVADTFDQAMEQLQAKHDELLGSAEAFHQGSLPAANITHPSEDQVRQKEQPAHKYGRHELQALAAADGIAGLRKIAETLGFKGTSKDGLIDGILEAQAEGDAPAAAEQSAEEAPPEMAEVQPARDAPRQFAEPPAPV